MEPVYAPVLVVAKSLFAAQGLTITRSGQENIPRSGGAVVAMNHFGYMDFALAGVPFDDVDRIVRFMAKKEVFDAKGVGFLMRGMKHIPVDRSAGAEAYREAVKALQSGELIGVFPEATISRAFELKEFKSGAVRMAQEAGVPLLPVTLWGSQRIWTKDHPKRLGRTKIPITITIGEPMAVGADDDITARTQDLKVTMKRMLDEAKAGYEPLTGADSVYLPQQLGGTAPSLEQAARLDEQERQQRAERKAAKAAERATG
ncbi:lysophospholipid acyltransferase family protein [Calidifontibacter terrae]